MDADAREARKNRQNRQNGNRRKGGRRGNRNGRTNPQQGGNNSNFQDEIANGRVPGWVIKRLYNSIIKISVWKVISFHVCRIKKKRHLSYFYLT